MPWITIIQKMAFTVIMDDLTGFQRDLLYVIAGAERPSG